MKEYEPKEIEKKWQKKWRESGIYKTPDVLPGKKNEMVLVEFAYPSGNLHVGHWYAFSVTDIYARYRRMMGGNVMFPFGFDSFGLPAENAAIKRNLNPRDWTYSNIEFMKNQLDSMGTMFDWDREVITSDPEYYRFTQWLFIQLFNKGLAYRTKANANWCSSCKTVLANEQVVGGVCERCGTVVEQRAMEQWMLKITDYADRLIDEIPESWPQPIRDSQANWIGRSVGAEIDFKISDSDKIIKVFTTRPDTLFGATYLVLAPDHQLVSELISQIGNKDEVEAYVEKTKRKTELERISEAKEKTGVILKGINAIHPGNGEKIPVYIADYVLSSYGTGAIMAVPSDDERDRDFAEKFGLPVISEYKPAQFEEYGKKVTKFKLRDWVVSRQRYWGCPIPLVFCASCNEWHPVKDSDLPVVLPEINDFLPTGDGQSPLAKVSDWVKTTCPKCGGEARRETDTLDTFIDSSWYFLRYTDPKNKDLFADKSKLASWMPVSFYSGGAEHTTMHLLYSRFFHKALFDLGLVNESEPYTNRLNRGLILGPDGNKMSKSKGNVIDPDEYVSRLGADTVRTYLAFIGPYNEPGSYPWNPDSIVGVKRFLERVYGLRDRVDLESAVIKDESVRAQAIKKVGESLKSLKMNTGVSSLMVYLNSLEKQDLVSREEYETLLKLLAPFAPHLSEEIWESLGHQNSIHLEAWPSFDESKLQSDEVLYVVQIASKIRGKFLAPANLSQAEVEERAKALPEVEKWLSNKTIIKSIFVPNKIINFVLAD